MGARKNDGRNEGHNSEDVLNGTAQRQLRAIIERIERVNGEIEEVQEVRKEIYAEAKGNGFDVKVLRKVIQRRKMDPAKRMEEEAILDLYEHAVEARRAKAEPEDDPDGVG